MIEKFATLGNILFTVGFLFEAAGLYYGTHTTVVMWTLIAYGVVGIAVGYVS